MHITGRLEAFTQQLSIIVSTSCWKSGRKSRSVQILRAREKQLRSGRITDCDGSVVVIGVVAVVVVVVGTWGLQEANKKQLVLDASGISLQIEP